MIIDVNIHLSRWPFRRLPCDELPRLLDKLREYGVVQAWAGSFDGLLHEDIDGVNRRLVDDCRRRGLGLLVPFGSVNPMLPDWKEDLRRCHEQYRMPGIRLHPNYHGYRLDDPAFAELLAEAERRGLIVQLAVRMEDTRSHHPLMQVPDVDVKPLKELLPRYPQLNLVLLNALRTVRGQILEQLVQAGRVFFEISMLEGIGGVGKFLRTVPRERVLFGSHLPFFIFESAVLKLQESSLSDGDRTAIEFQNAQRLLTM
ncbi:MAG: amidohydrolase family protein [Planctomycetes bacterium]|nr:amidohydrolase family protein [Planctomycetota bacterium]